MIHDLYQETTHRIIAAIEAGTTPPWVKPWSEAGLLPRNGATHRAYRGINHLLLGLETELRGYPQSRWLTFRQAAELGAHVRSGERGVRVVFYKPQAFRSVDEDPPQQRTFPVLRGFTVFNVSQIDGLPAPLMAPVAAWEAHGDAEALLLASGAEIRHGSSRAYYNPGTDTIHIPPRQAFNTQYGYYATALHELIHRTGHATRCNRDLRGRFGDDAYAMEELIAELGCSFLCAHCGIDGQLQHAAYLHAWLRVLKADKRAIFAASAKAQQAADFVLAAIQPLQKTEEAA